MLSLALFYLAAVICSARHIHTLPLYPDTNLEPHADFIQKLMSEVEDQPNTAEEEQREVNNLYPLLMQHNGDRDSWHNEMKASSQQDQFANTVEDLKEAVLKLAAADKLRSHFFVRSEHNLPKTNKRACFWKYCVTN